MPTRKASQRKKVARDGNNVEAKPGDEAAAERHERVAITQPSQEQGEGDHLKQNGRAFAHGHRLIMKRECVNPSRQHATSETERDVTWRNRP